ncbi:MAG: hypothetical protein H8D56_02920 [Planctomycetes bacterium]|nr:hypothetical protein [Planctomycetota bacterium]
MKIDYLKDKKELVSVVLLCVSAGLAVLILVKVTGFFTAPAKARNIVKAAIEQNTEDASDIDKYFAKYKMLADALKKNNLFAPPAPKEHPVKEVLGIFGDEVIIKDKLYKVGSKVGDATIVAIEATQVTIEWDGKKKTFSPINSGESSQPDGPRGSRPTAGEGGPRPGGGNAQMVTVGSQGVPGGGPGGGFGREMMERFQNLSEPERDRFRSEMQERRERYMNMSEAERERFRTEMRERMMGGGRPPDGGRGPGSGRGSGDGRRGGR